ncbi:MAG: hypothetical protein LLG02_00930 [Pelosinus sp.]|nr:hypothetical protein [Pelosinus sp.]
MYQDYWHCFCLWEIAPRFGWINGQLLLFATTVVISALGLTLNYLFTRLEHRIISWKEDSPEY